MGDQGGQLGEGRSWSCSSPWYIVFYTTIYIPGRLFNWRIRRNKKVKPRWKNNLCNLEVIQIVIVYIYIYIYIYSIDVSLRSTGRQLTSDNFWKIWKWNQFFWFPVFISLKDQNDQMIWSLKLINTENQTNWFHFHIFQKLSLVSLSCLLRLFIIYIYTVYIL